MGFQTAAMALKEDSVSIEDTRIRGADRLAVILGTEGDGLAEETIADCDFTIRIPMSHGVDSLSGGSQRSGLLGTGEIER